MEVDSDNDLLGRTAAGELVASEAWPALRDELLERLDKIVLNEFPIPKLPPPLPRSRYQDTRRPISPPSSPPASEQFPDDANKENAPAQEQQPAPAAEKTEPGAPASQSQSSLPPPPQQQQQQPSSSQTQEPGALPKQLADMVDKSHIASFKSYPPHTIQRIAELILRPRAHYKALASYLHALDRVAAVTSGTDTYPLPPPIPDMSSIQLNGDEPNDPAMAVSWSNPTAVAVGSDEALGGALLTPIPWLVRRSTPPESVSEAAAAPTTTGAQIHSESTETIEGPNGVGSIETVSVSINGVPSMGASRGVTQGELLRQEQRAGIVPVSQLTKGHDMMGEGGRTAGPGPSEDHPMGDEEDEEDEEEAPHVRGPDEIGIGDTGPQSETTSLVGEDGIEMQGIDLEAAVGRKHAEEKDAAAVEEASPVRGQDAEDGSSKPSFERSKSPSAESVASKREAEDDLEDDVVAKKVKEDNTAEDGEDTKMTSGTPSPEAAAKGEDDKEGDDAKEEDADKKDKDAAKMEEGA
ncbi:hypothetical protein BBK36DRAFT_1133101 [Trichoderma citrinoviride]|uniref:PPP4R2-domain-containing protein n=1 Tax=Trichoderma citrinoviride TaxID=58853 RepID=A0A2T4BFU9_9HYPO|nr:hypothetical protein BBK36DRAFT_1133101 [Trichoderma citrinoviride]PTB68194.1 hypothetical protein BBK36DRAFT_1133101 [Trichoderma citrinoviride]